MKRAKSSIYISTDDSCFLVVETPSEVREMVMEARLHDHIFVELTLGNESKWNGKPLYVKWEYVVAISPPKDQTIDEE